MGSCVIIKLQLFKHSSSPLRLKEMQGQLSGCITFDLEEDGVAKTGECVLFCPSVVQ